MRYYITSYIVLIQYKQCYIVHFITVNKYYITLYILFYDIIFNLIYIL